MTHILDDFLLVSKNREAGSQARQSFETLCQYVGIPLAPEKTEGPTTCLTFAGIELDTEKMEARLPVEKKEKAIAQIKAILPRKRITLRELQSIIGLLNFATKVVWPGRCFLRRLINLTIGPTKPSHHIRLNGQGRADLQAWLLFLEKFNGKAIFLKDQWVIAKELSLYTDASGTIGYGAVFGTHFFYGQWPESWKHVNIAFLELYPIVAAVELWAPQLANQRILLHTDNMALVHILNSQTSKDNRIMVLVRRLIVLCMLHNIMFKALHIEGVSNSLADALSRQQVERFRDLAPRADLYPTQLPEHIQPNNLFPD